MAEPTIDDLLASLKYADDQYGVQNYLAIRAILEQHKSAELCADAILTKHRRVIELEAIRAFVERVEKRLPDYDTGRTADAMLKAYRRAVYDELAAMEKEAE